MMANTNANVADKAARLLSWVTARQATAMVRGEIEQETFWGAIHRRMAERIEIGSHATAVLLFDRVWLRHCTRQLGDFKTDMGIELGEPTWKFVGTPPA